MKKVLIGSLVLSMLSTNMSFAQDAKSVSPIELENRMRVQKMQKENDEIRKAAFERMFTDRKKATHASLMQIYASQLRPEIISIQNAIQLNDNKLNDEIVAVAKARYSKLSEEMKYVFIQLLIEDAKALEYSKIKATVGSTVITGVALVTLGFAILLKTTEKGSYSRFMNAHYPVVYGVFGAMAAYAVSSAMTEKNEKIAIEIKNVIRALNQEQEITLDLITKKQIGM